MPADVNYPKVDIQSTDGERHRRDIAVVVNSLRDGKINAALTFSLDVAPAITTTITDPRIATSSRIHLVPLDDHALADYSAGAIKIASVSNSQFIVSHTMFGLARTFRCSFLA